MSITKEKPKIAPEKLEAMKLLRHLQIANREEISSVNQKAFLVSAWLQPGIDTQELKKLIDVTAQGVGSIARYAIKKGLAYSRTQYGPEHYAGRNQLYYLTDKGTEKVSRILGKGGKDE